MADLLLDVRYGLPGIGLDQRRFSSSVARPSWTIRLPENILGLGFAPFLPQPQQGGLVMIRASEPPMKLRLCVESVTL